MALSSTVANFGAAAAAAPATQPGTPSRPLPGCEAARYGILRRLGPALKHDMVVNLQAVAMMSEVLGAKLERGMPAQAELQGSVARINRLAREAVANCLKVASWIEPAEDEGIALRDGVEECLALLRSNFNFRGFSLRTEVPAAEFEVSRMVLRHLLVGSLLSLTDRVDGPGEVSVVAEAGTHAAQLALQFSPQPADEEPVPFDAGYRRLEWNDVQALALDAAVELQRTDNRISMRLPRMMATTPLQIAPL